MKFLVVDESQMMRRIVNNALKNVSYEDIVETRDVKDAIGKLYVEKVDFIITDWNMPNMSGFEFTKAVRGDEQFADLPLLKMRLISYS